MNHWVESSNSESEKFSCASCSSVVKGANGRTFCVLNHSAPDGQLPSDISILRLEEWMEIYPIMVRRIMHGMVYPGEENACSYHPELSRIEEMRGIELTLLDWQTKPIEEWGLTVRVTNVLRAEQVTLSELIDMGEAKFRKFPNMWKKCALEVRYFLKNIWVDWKV